MEVPPAMEDDFEVHLDSFVSDADVNLTAHFESGNVTLEIFPYCGQGGELYIMVRRIC